MYAKTLYKPQRPDWADQFLSRYTSKKVPYFFQEAKGKEPYQVAPLNDSLVNKLRKLIKNLRIDYRNLANFNYRLLMSDQSVHTCADQIQKVYDALSREYHFKLAHTFDIEEDNFSYIVSKCREKILALGDDPEYVLDQLVYYLFNKRSKKSLLWACFGDNLYERLKNNIDLSTKCCHRCGKRFKARSNRQKYCDDCAGDMKREKTRMRLRKMREKHVKR